MAGEVTDVRRAMTVTRRDETRRQEAFIYLYHQPGEQLQRREMLLRIWRDIG